MVKCPKCNGNKYLMYYINGPKADPSIQPCPLCHGKGEIEKYVNADWLDMQNLEGKALFLTNICRDSITYAGGKSKSSFRDDMNYWKRWLLQERGAEKKEITNEDYLFSLPTEEKAKVIVNLGREQRFPKDVEVEICEQWLKEIHR